MSTTYAPKLCDRQVQHYDRVYLFEPGQHPHLVIAGTLVGAIRKYENARGYYPADDAGAGDYMGRYSLVVCDRPIHKLPGPLPLDHYSIGRVFLREMTGSWVSQPTYVLYQGEEPELYPQEGCVREFIDACRIGPGAVIL